MLVDDDPAVRVSLRRGLEVADFRGGIAAEGKILENSLKLSRIDPKNGLSIIIILAACRGDRPCEQDIQACK